MTTAAQNIPQNCTVENEEYLSPRVDIYEDKEAYVLQAEMPGVNKEGLEVTLADNELTLTGRRAEAAPQSEALHRESRPLNYRRAFELDPAIDTARIEASIAQGVLTLRLPKAEKIKPRKITVTE
jgi:HSP20 family protein